MKGCPPATLPGKPASGRLTFALYLLPLALAAAVWALDPFARPLVVKTFSLSELNPAQRANIAVAARALDGTVVRPGERFSFNGRVGPRTGKHGYAYASSYLGSESPLTAGGGICLLSSALYQAALQSGFPIYERAAHARTVRSVPPGLDATVWYGQADLRFGNNAPFPIMIGCRVDGSKLAVAILGARFARAESCPLWRRVTCLSGCCLQVEVTRRRDGRAELVSRDLYRLSR